MTLTAFKKTKLSDMSTEQLQNNIAAFAKQLVNIPILPGRIIEDISVISGVNSISHGLGRPVQGYVLVKSSAAVRIYTVEANQTNPDTILSLSADATATINLYVF